MTTPGTRRLLQVLLTLLCGKFGNTDVWVMVIRPCSGDCVGRTTGRGLGPVAGDAVEEVGVEPDGEQVDELAGDLGLGHQGRLDILLAEGRPGLTEVLGHGAQDDDLAPGEPGTEDERVEAVRLDPAVPDRGHAEGARSPKS